MNFRTDMGPIMQRSNRKVQKLGPNYQVIKYLRQLSAR